jgi:hypothetical protein
MPLQSSHPLQEVEIYGQLASVVNTAVLSMHAPFQGRVIKVGAVLSAATAAADATLTTNIAGAANPITGGVVIVTQSGSAAGSTFTATPTGANTCNEDDPIGVVVTGTGTGGGPVTVFAKIRRGTF